MGPSYEWGNEKKKDIWEIIERRGGKKPVGCWWIYTLKQKLYDTLDRYKARLMVKFYTQTCDIEYEETFALVVKMNIIQILLSIFGYSGCKIK